MFGTSSSSWTANVFVFVVYLGQGVGSDIVYYAFNTIYNVFARTSDRETAAGL